MRLDRLLVERGFGSRKESGKAVRHGRVMVAGVLVRDPRQHVDELAAVVVNGEPLERPPRLVAWHKPVGVLTTLRDPWGREGLDEVLPAPWRRHLHAVGRLDLDTSGLLLFSSDGTLTQQLLHPKHATPRTYRAGVEAVPTDLAERLAAGVETAEGTFTGAVGLVEGLEVTVTVTEGKHRMVRRMLHNAGATVLTLHRLAFGPVQLGDLEPRQFRVVESA